MKNLLALVCFCALIPNSIKAQYPQMNFPLQVGNLWQYTEAPGYYSDSKAIKDTLMPNGLTYTQITGGFHNGFFRKEDSKMFSYDFFSNDEYLLYDFSLKTGDTLSFLINNGDTIITTLYEEGTRDIFGQQRYYMAFLTEYSTSTMYGIDYVTDGFGFTGYNGEVFYYGLTGAIINGVRYGVVLEVKETERNLPNKYLLFQNYPNPFNPTTLIKYFIPNTALVTLKIYNAIGSEVAILVNEEKPSGFYEVKFNATELPSGIYYYQISTGDFTEVRKMILIK